MKRLSTSVIIREMQTKTTMRYHFISTRMTILIKKKESTGTSLVVQWLRMCLPMQETQVPSLVGVLRSYVPRDNSACEPQWRPSTAKKKKNNNKCWQGWAKETLIHCWWECKMIQASLENSLTIPQNAKHRVPIRPSNSTPRYIPKRNENMFTQKLVHECSW